MKFFVKDKKQIKFLGSLFYYSLSLLCIIVLVAKIYLKSREEKERKREKNGGKERKGI